MKDSSWIRVRSSAVTDAIIVYTIYITAIFQEQFNHSLPIIIFSHDGIFQGYTLGGISTLFM